MKKKISYAQEMLMKSLIKLMKKDSFRDITVTQITQEAKVARKTFYLNFKTKEAVLRLFSKTMGEKFKTYMDDKDNISIQSLATSFFQFSKDHIELIELLIKNGVFMILVEEFEFFIEEEIIKKRLLSLYDESTIEKLPTKYTIYYHAAGLCKLLEKWILNDMAETPEEMGEIFKNLVSIGNQ